MRPWVLPTLGLETKSPPTSPHGHPFLPRRPGTKVPDGRAEGKDTVHVVGGGGRIQEEMSNMVGRLSAVGPTTGHLLELELDLEPTQQVMTLCATRHSPPALSLPHRQPHQRGLVSLAAVCVGEKRMQGGSRTLRATFMAVTDRGCSDDSPGS